MEERYTAAMVLAGVGDAMGYKCGDWEFCFDGDKIHNDVKSLGGVAKLKIQKPEFIVSDDTVLLLSTSEALVKESNTASLDKLFTELAFRYKKDFTNDMKDRAGGITTASACQALQPDKPNGWQINFNPCGGGCGGAMRSMSIGLRYPNVYDVDCLQKLIVASVESGRMTHNHPTGFLGSFASALFAALSIVKVPVIKWGSILMALLPKVLRYIKKAGRDVEENKKAWNYFGEQWEKYLLSRNVLSGDSDAVFPEIYNVKDRDVFYKSLAFHGWGGASGHDAPMIAYDALLFAKDNWIDLCHHGMLHSGDNDSTGVISGFCFGAMYGYKGVPKCNYENVEYNKRLNDAGKELFQQATHDSYFSFDENEAIAYESLFKH